MSSPSLSELAQLENRKSVGTVPSRLSITSTFSTFLRSFKKKKQIDETVESETSNSTPISFATLKPVAAAVRNWDDLSLPEINSINRRSSLEKSVLSPLDAHARQRAASVPLTEDKSISPTSPPPVSSLTGSPSVLTMSRGKKADTRIDGAPVRKSSLANDDLSAEDLHKLSTLQRSSQPSATKKGILRTIDRAVPERNGSLPRNAVKSQIHPPKRNSSLQPFLASGVTFSIEDSSIASSVLKPEEPLNPDISRSEAIPINRRSRPDISLDINPSDFDPVTKTVLSPTSATSLEKYKTLSLSPARSSPPKFMTLVPDIRGARSTAGEQDLVDMKKWVFEKELEAIDAIAPELSLRRKSIKRSTTYKETHVALTPTISEFPEPSENSTNEDVVVEESLIAPNDSNDSMTTKTSSIPEIDILKDVNLLGDENAEPTPPQPPAAAKIAEKLEIFKPSVEDDYLNKSPIGSIKYPAPNLLPSADNSGKNQESAKSQLTAGLRKGSPKKKPWKWFTNIFGSQKKSDGWDPYPKDYILPNRLSEAQETEVYSLSHVKLAQTERPLLQQVQISNFMMYILSVHSSVTIKGRGPQRRKRRKRRRVVRNPLIPPSGVEAKVEPPPPPPVVKKDDDKDDLTSSSSSDDEEDQDGDIKAKDILKMGPAVPLISKIPSKGANDEEDEIPLAVLARTVKK